MEVRIDGESYAVTVRVHYSNHCWTKTRKDESEDAILFYEHHSDWVDARVFCQTRWEFSLQLPEIVASLSHSLCLPGRSKEIFYRVKADKEKGGHAGWYVCARLNAIQSKQEITLSIRSVHYRTNRPEDTRGGPRRFWALFWDFYKDLRAKHDWVVAGETKTNPRTNRGVWEEMPGLLSIPTLWWGPDGQKPLAAWALPLRDTGYRAPHGHPNKAPEPRQLAQGRAFGATCSFLYAIH